MFIYIPRYTSEKNPQSRRRTQLCNHKGSLPVGQIYVSVMVAVVCEASLFSLYSGAKLVAYRLV